MASMRAQLSLQFNDEDMFYNFIKPYKDQRLLNNLIMKCLTAYYYDEAARNQIEGVGMEDVADSDAISSTQEICNSIRESLMMQDFMVQELRNTIDTGTEDVSEILNQTNKAAEDRGVAKSTTNSSGSSILKIESKKQDISDEESSSSKPVDEMSMDVKINTIIKAVEILASASGNIEVKQLFSGIESSDSVVDIETVSQTTESQVPLDETISDEISADIDEGIDVPIETPAPVVETKEPEPEEDATDVMNELLGSLF
jgi:hypothetical protein